MDAVDIIIAGGGVIGLAVAYECSRRWPGKSILLLEREAAFGQGLSSRTSEVIHSGIYYPPGSLKAKLCVAGNELLYSFCEQHHVPHKKIGKLIVAKDETEQEKLALLQMQAGASQVPDVTLLSTGQVTRLEPHIQAASALLCSTSGIVDSHRLMAQLAQQAREQDAMLVFRQEITGVREHGNRFIIEYRNENGAAEEIGCRAFVNAAGMAADQIAAMAGIAIDEAGYRIYRCKGEYFAVHNRKAALVSHLVFPVSIRELKGAGIPVIKDLRGRLRLGPDAHYASATAEDYGIAVAGREQFFKLVQPYLPFLESRDLEPDIAGIRPRLLVPCGSPPRDFVVCHETDRGLPGLINLIGIESPGITCCLSLARLVADMLAPEL